ncbi:large conductance mechanosensitive channel protein MscL [Virgibacillus sp. NKC19-3]|uniref:large conductance mechanosensitive channel protein MscL n=1 Tax=Virgibacillus saliphilus TaxID=2831674 RepID=UPI001C9B4359|nr:large conductance mechanosensitive channel protein MscL [Virgibacillus sp. NKC19-3]MBY7144551.1 large conductance mechanosensitive channel protein MscL [Virgibacillus sp. NKC19-3]
MGLFREFRQFAMKGNAVDIGVGVVLGAAFSGLIDSLVKDILLPPIGLLYSKVNFQDHYISLDGTTYPSLEQAKEAGAATINYGLFITAFIRFMLILFVVFLVIRQINRWKKPHQHPSDSMTKKECPYCRTPIPTLATICPNCSSVLDKQESIRKAGPKWRMK